MKKTAFISNLIFAFFVAFLFSLCFLRYQRISLLLSTFCSLLFASIVLLATYFPLDKRRKRLVVERREGERRDDLILYLSLLPERKCAEFFCPFFPFYTIRVLGGTYALEGKDEVVFPFFTVRPFDGDLSAKIVRVETNKKKVLYTGTLSPEGKELLSRFFVEVHTKDEIYQMVKEKDLLPSSPLFHHTSPLKERAKIWFSKKNARSFFLSGIFLLLTSLITPFPFYYLVFGGLLLLATIFLRIYGV